MPETRTLSPSFSPNSLSSRAETRSASGEAIFPKERIIYQPVSLKNVLGSFTNMTMRNAKYSAFTALLFVLTVQAGPKFDDGGFVPSSMLYLEKSGKSQDQIAMASETQQSRSEPAASTTSTRRTGPDASNIEERSQEARFGFTNIGSTGSGYGVSPYAPAKIDLGGLLLGAIIGVGSILIIPKVLYVLSGSYGAYARSDESGFAQTMTKLDDVLARHGVDTTSCMQRTVCAYSQEAAIAARDAPGIEQDEKQSSFESIINTVTTNQIFRSAMEGTAIQEAVDSGRAGRNCSRIYPHCGFSIETMFSLLTNVIASATTSNTQPHLPPTGSPRQ